MWKVPKGGPHVLPWKSPLVIKWCKPTELTTGAAGTTLFGVVRLVPDFTPKNIDTNCSSQVAAGCWWELRSKCSRLARLGTTLDPWTTRTVGIATSKIWCTWMVTPIHTIGVHLRKYAWNPPWGRPCTMGPCPVCWHHFRKVNLDTKPWMERYCVPAADQPFEIWRRWTTSGADNDGPPRWGWLIGTAELKSILKWVASRDNGNLASQKLRINLRKCFFLVVWEGWDMLGHGKGVPIGLSVEEHPMGWDTLPLIYI